MAAHPALLPTLVGLSLTWLLGLVCVQVKSGDPDLYLHIGRFPTLTEFKSARSSLTSPVTLDLQLLTIVPLCLAVYTVCPLPLLVRAMLCRGMHLRVRARCTSGYTATAAGRAPSHCESVLQRPQRRAVASALKLALGSPLHSLARDLHAIHDELK